MGNKGKYSFYVEDKALQVTERPRRFLEAFAAVLEHSNYGLPLEVYTRLSSKCSRCAASCQLYQSTGEDRDIPCHRSELLLRIYRRYFTKSGILKARLFAGFSLTDQHLDELTQDALGVVVHRLEPVHRNERPHGRLQLEQWQSRNTFL